MKQNQAFEDLENSSGLNLKSLEWDPWPFSVMGAVDKEGQSAEGWLGEWVEREQDNSLEPRKRGVARATEGSEEMRGLFPREEEVGLLGK